MKKFILLFFLLMTTALYAQNKGFMPKPPRKVGDPVPKCTKNHMGTGPATMYDLFRPEDGLHIWKCSVCKHFIIHEEQCTPVKKGNKYKCSLHPLSDFVQLQERDENGYPYFKCELSGFKFHGNPKQADDSVK